MNSFINSNVKIALFVLSLRTLLLVFLLILVEIWNLLCFCIRPVGRHWICKWILLQTSAEAGQVARFPGGRKPKNVVNYSGKIKRYIYCILPKRQISHSIILMEIFVERVMTPTRCNCHVMIKIIKAMRGKYDIVLNHLGCVLLEVHLPLSHVFLLGWLHICPNYI